MTTKLERLAWAMIEHEGWKTAGEEPQTAGSRSYRNHNPGNLRASPFQAGTIDGFAYFKSDMQGLNALMWDIEQKAKGNTSTGLTGESTLRDLIKVWAPNTDNNDTEIYIQIICFNTGLKDTDKLKDIVV